ncbi:YlxR family protein [Mycobacteroides chelonae]|uniref:YlxR family protein n=1 Tax=Mycobacteroides chelonae TaxID=1774 RepID=UPI0009BFFFC7|nr:YlxR family protein [Mycobacteroides chelonae]AYM42799.1 YlxR family protein [[Mycobacterium] chelonae subsp. gwanakae]MBV0919616.1 YlxR family protein [Mycobacteroides chelonae]
MIQRETSAFAHAPTGEPVRTCIGCRGRELAADLLRVVAADDRHVVVDIRRRLPGRGAWLHRSAQCYHLAVKRRAFARALRIGGTPDTSVVFEHVEQYQEIGNDKQ